MYEYYTGERAAKLAWDVIHERVYGNKGTKDEQSLKSCPLWTKYFNGDLDKVPVHEKFLSKPQEIPMNPPASFLKDAASYLDAHPIILKKLNNTILAIVTAELPPEEKKERMAAAAMHALIYGGMKSVSDLEKWNQILQITSLPHERMDQIKKGIKHDGKKRSILLRPLDAMKAKAYGQMRKKFWSEEMMPSRRVTPETKAAILRNISSMTSGYVQNALRKEEDKTASPENRRRYAAGREDARKRQQNGRLYLCHDDEEQVDPTGIMATLKRIFNTTGKVWLVLLALALVASLSAGLIVAGLPVMKAILLSTITIGALTIASKCVFICITNWLKLRPPSKAECTLELDKELNLEKNIQNYKELSRKKQEQDGKEQAKDGQAPAEDMKARSDTVTPGAHGLTPRGPQPPWANPGPRPAGVGAHDDSQAIPRPPHPAGIGAHGSSTANPGPTTENGADTVTLGDRARAPKEAQPPQAIPRSQPTGIGAHGSSTGNEQPPPIPPRAPKQGANAKNGTSTADAQPPPGPRDDNTGAAPPSPQQANPAGTKHAQQSKVSQILQNPPSAGRHQDSVKHGNENQQTLRH